MNYYVIFSCFMQRIKIIDPTTGETIDGSERGYGFFSMETDFDLEPDYQQCSYYADDVRENYFDGWVESGKAFAIISQILGTICFLVLFNTCWCAFSQETFSRWLVWLYLLAAGSIGLAFLVFGAEFCSENRCKVAAGSGYTITVFMFWLSTCNTVKSIGAPMPRPPSDGGTGSHFGNEDDEFADLYYENEYDKYPIPECTPEGRRRYAAAAEYADDTDRQQRRQAGGDSDSSYDSDDESSEESDEGSTSDNSQNETGRRPRVGEKDGPKIT